MREVMGEIDHGRRDSWGRREHGLEIICVPGGWLLNEGPKCEQGGEGSLTCILFTHADGSDAVRAVEKLGKQRGTRRSSFLTEEVVLATAGEGR